MTPGVFENDLIDFSLLGMSAPTGGQFTCEQSGYKYMDTSDGISTDDAVTDFPVYGHDHYKWTFSTPGVYKLTFQSSATRISTGVLETSVDTFTFLVGSTVWTGSNGSNWNDVGNWLSGNFPPNTIVSAVPGYGSTVIFTSSTDPNQPLTQDIAAPLDLHGVIFTVNAGSYHLGGQTLRLSVDSPAISSESPNSQEIANPLVLAADTTFAVNGSGNLTLSGAISGGGSITKTGPGTLILAAEATHNGNTIILDGILALNTAGQIENSAIVNDSTFEILGGTHSVTTISGDGDTAVLAGGLTADSIVQNMLTIAPGAIMTISPLPGGPLGGSLRSVPEPSSWILLGCAMVSSVMIHFRGRNSHP